MTYIHLTTDELVMLKAYYHQYIFFTIISTYLKRSRTPIYNVINFLKEGHSALDYYQRYKENKQRCDRNRIVLPKKEQAYIKKNSP